MAAKVVAPIAVAYVRGRRCEVGLLCKRLEIYIGVAREADLIAVTAKSAPTVVNQGATVGTAVLHIVEIHMVAPKCLAEAVDAVVCQFLLPVEPPEVNTLGLARTHDMLEKRFVEI